MNLDNKKSDSETQIFFVVRYNSQRFKIASSKKIVAAHWNNTNQKVNSKNKNANSINAILQKEKSEIQKQLDNLIFANKIISKEAILPFLSFGKMKKSSAEAAIFNTYDFYINSIKNHLSKSTIKNHSILKRDLKIFCEKYKYSLTFESCNSIFYNQYVQYLVHDRKNQNSNIDKLTTQLKTFLNWASENGYNNNLQDKKFKAPGGGTKEIFSLSKEDLKLIENFEAPAAFVKIKDIFLFECYTGLRYSDIQKLRPENVKDNKIELVTVKTKQNLFIPLHTKAQNILVANGGQDYSFPQISNQNMNKQLKKFAQLAKLDEEIIYHEYKGNQRIEKKKKKFQLISTHTGRHTFITISLLLGIDPETVKKITGHTTFKSFEKYIHYNDKTLIEQIQKWN